MDANRDKSEDLTGKYFDIFCDILRDLDVDEEKAPVPLQVWEGIALALAAYSGYRIAIQTVVLTPEDETGTMHLVEFREMAALDPTYWYKYIKTTRTENTP